MMGNFLKVLTLGLLLIIAVVALRTWQFSPPPVKAAGTMSVVPWQSDALAEGLAAALRIATVSHADASRVDTEAFDEFQRFLQQRFPLTFARIPHERIAGHSLLFRWAGTDPEAQPVLLLAHQDVVPVIPGTESDWHYPPFSGAIAEGYIWGRGAVDDKASVVGIFEAVERLLQEGFTPPRTVYLGFGHDEEVGGKGAIAMARRIAERGERLAFLLDEGGVMVKGLMPGVDRSIALIGPAEKGYVSLQLLARGEGGHSSMPPPQTAAGIVAAAVARLEARPMPARLDYSIEFFRYLSEALPLYQRVLFANDWLFAPLIESVLSSMPPLNAGMRTTTAVTMLEGSVQDNVLPLTASAVVNFRILPGDTVADVEQRVAKIIDDPRIEISRFDGFGSNPSSVASLEGAGFEVLSDIVTRLRPDVLVAPRLVVAATDARHFEAVSDNSYRFVGVELGPQEIAGIHGTNERVSIESYTNAVAVYYHLLKRSKEL